MNDLRQLGPKYESFTLDWTDEAAEAAFVAKHGYTPEETIRDGTIVKVGPIRKESDGCM